MSFYFPTKQVGKTLELFVKEPHFNRALGVKGTTGKNNTSEESNHEAKVVA